MKHNLDALSELVLEYIKDHPEGVPYADIRSTFLSEVPKDAENPARVLPGTIGTMTRQHLIYQDDLTKFYYAVNNATPHGVVNSVPAYLRGRDGYAITIYHDIDILEDVVDIQVSPDGQTWWPCAFSGASNVSIARDIPNWGPDMRVYRAVCAIKFIYRKDGKLVDKIEDTRGLGLSLCIVAR